MFSQHISRGAVLAIALSGTALVVAARAEPTADVGNPPLSAQQEVLGAEFGATPRSSMLGFLTAARERNYTRAAQHLNLSSVPQAKRAERGPKFARQLKTVLDRALWIDIDQLSDDPSGAADDGLPLDHERVGTIESAAGAVAVLLDRVPNQEGALVWKIAASTVQRVPALYDEFGHGRLGEILPSVFFEKQFLAVQLWQWLGLILLVLFVWLGTWLAALMAVAVARPLVARSTTSLDDRLLESAVGPARLAAAMVLFSAGSYALDLSVPARHFVNGCAVIGGLVAATWFALRAIDLISSIALSRIDAGRQRAAQQFVPLGRKTVKVAIVLLAGLAALDSFGLDVTALIAGLGIGGLAVALALQRTIENLFGGATLLADRPVQVGDFCRFGDQLGTIEEIGIRSTRVRTLDRTLVTVPNAEFATMQLENYTLRDKIWYHPTIGLRYETTPEQLRYVLVEVRRMLYAHPKVDPDPARIRFNNFGAYSLDLEVFAYVKATDFGEFLEVAEDLNLRILEIVEAAGTGFAFPSSTTYLAHDGGLDADRARTAEAAVASWRDKSELYLPGFPQQKIAELADTLDYPPLGSPVSQRPRSCENDSSKRTMRKSANP